MDGWTWVLQLADHSWPLAILAVCGVGVYRTVRWLGVKFVEPLGGPDGKLAKWLDAQAAQHHATIDANKSLTLCMGEAVAQIRGIRASTENTERTLGETWAKARHMSQDGLERLSRIETRVDAVVRAKLCLCQAIGKEASDPTRLDDLQRAIQMLDSVIDD